MIIEDDDILESLSKTFSSEQFWVPIWGADNRPAQFNEVIGLFISDLKVEGKWCYISINHPESTNISSIDLVLKYFDAIPHIHGYKEFQKLHKIPGTDTLSNAYLTSGKVLDLSNIWTHAHHYYSRRGASIKYVNRIIPIVKHIESCWNIFKEFYPIYKTNPNPKGTDFITKAINIYGQIEQVGLRVDEDELSKHFTTQVYNGFVYPEYHLYNKTGRPSNNRAGINFSALKKDDGTRESFISRFNGGKLVEFDFDAFHLRLIGILIKHKFQIDVSVHDTLGEIYFNTQQLTSEQRDKAKSISFRQLYGGVQDEYMSIEFFNKVHAFTEVLWTQWNNYGLVKTPSGRELLKSAFPGMNKNKLFNYFLQAVENEYMVAVLGEILPILQDTNTKVILTTYDSILVDWDSNETDVINSIKSLMERGNMMVKPKFGDTYNKVS